jgi:hypothetical protein
MSDLRHDQQPKTQTSSAGGPPKPPKKAAQGFADDSSDDHLKKLSAAELAEIKQWIKKLEASRHEDNDA